MCHKFFESLTFQPVERLRPLISIEIAAITIMTDASFDIVPLMAPFFDVHMIFPLLDFLREIKAHDDKLITKEKIRAVEHTNMVEFVEDEYDKFPQDEDMQSEYKSKQDQFAQRKQQIFGIIDNEPEVVQKVTNFFAARDVVEKLQSEGHYRISYLSNSHSITPEALEAYYKFSKFKYECGMYIDAETMLTNYLELLSSSYSHGGASSVSYIAHTLSSSNSSSPSLSTYQSALWGRLACRIVQGKWSEASADLSAVKEAIEVKHTPAPDQLRQRAYLMHWSLFVNLNQRDGIDALCDLFSERYYLQCLENLCPWLLRYYTVAFVLSPHRRRSGIQDLLNEISSLSYMYSDPITEFLASLFDAFDFDIAQVKLTECQKLLKNDFFLQVHAEKFMQEARMLICEMYASVHRTVDLKMLAQKLQFTDEEAERWTADLVRGGAHNTSAVSLLDAKIDSFGRQVIIAPPSKAGPKQVVEVTKELTARTAVLGMNLEALVKEQALYLNNRA